MPSTRNCALSKLAKLSLLSVLLLLAFVSTVTVIFFHTHSLCHDDTGQIYFSDAPTGSALPCLLEPGANEIIRSSNLYTNGTFQIVIGDAGPSVSIRQIQVMPAFSTVVTTQVTTTCDGCSTQTFTMTEYPDTPCTGLTPLVSHSYITETCTFSNPARISNGQTYGFTLQFSDGQEIGGSVTAENS